MEERSTFILELRPLAHVDGIKAIRAVLKALLRTYRLQCTRITEYQTTGDKAMSKYADKIAKQKENTYYQIGDFQVNGNPENTRELTHEISFLQEDVEMFNREVDILHFTDTSKYLIVNTFHADTLIELFGEEPAQWPGHKVTLYLAPYGWQGKMGIRIRAADASQSTGSAPSVPTQSQTPAATSKKSLKEEMSDDIPF
jgi:hypothetical protein